MAEDSSDASARFERFLDLAGRVIAPSTLIGTLLFYYGYVSSRAQYDYFGLDVDVIGLSTQEYVMRSPQPLLVPAIAFTLAGAGLITLNGWIRGRSSRPDFGTWIRRAVRLGLATVATGVLLVLAYPWLDSWRPYPLLTPVVLGLGSALVGYALVTLRWLAGQPGQPATAAATRPRLSLVLSVFATTAVCLFWATATFAQWAGAGLARDQARHLDDLPSVVVDTAEQLHLPAASGVTEVALPAADGSTYRYRYWGLRLLLAGNGKLFVVPDRWSSHDTTLVLRDNADVRLQFQFRNLEP